MFLKTQLFFATFILY